MSTCLACWSSAGLSSLFPFFDSNLLASLLEHAVGTYLCSLGNLGFGCNWRPPLLSFYTRHLVSGLGISVVACSQPILPTRTNIVLEWGIVSINCRSHKPPQIPGHALPIIYKLHNSNSWALGISHLQVFSGKDSPSPRLQCGVDTCSNMVKQNSRFWGIFSNFMGQFCGSIFLG